MSVVVEDAHAHLFAARAAPTPTVLGCDEESPTFPGRLGGIAVAPDGTVFVSVPASGDIWRLELPWARSASAAPIERVWRGDATLQSPAGLAVGPDGSLFVADSTGHRVWVIPPAGEPRLVAGSVYGFRDGAASDALFRNPSDVAVGPDGTCFVADAGNHRIRTISPEGLVTTLAGSIYDFGDGRGPDGRFREPLGLDVDGDGTCYVADTGNNAVRRVACDGATTTLAGVPVGGKADGIGAEVGLRWPTGIAIGHDGELWVADHGNGALRRIDPHGASTTALRLAGRSRPLAVALAPDGAVLVAAEVIGTEGQRQSCLFSTGRGR